MKTVFSAAHSGHAGQMELVGGAMVAGYEKPSRAELVRARVEAVGLGPLRPANPHDLAAARRVHRPDYVDFLPKVWPMWTAEGRHGTALPFTWPMRVGRDCTRPDGIDGLLGYYSYDAGAGFVEGTYEAIKGSYDTVLTAASLVNDGEESAFALCRPPGHHAGTGFMGGYCYLNNAAVAARWFRDRGAARVTVLDVDYHHGNGTQEIFYQAADVQVVSLHGDPMTEYPFFMGHADERGAGAGEGFNLNFPMPAGTAWENWGATLDEAVKAVEAFGPDVLVVSLGVDTYEHDPISRFKLTTGDFPRIGERIARLRKPTLFVMEGGYAIDDVGINMVGVLTGYLGR